MPTLERALEAAAEKTQLSTKHARKIFHILLTAKEFVKVTEDLYFTKKVLEELVIKVKEYAEKEAENRLITIPIFKDIAGVFKEICDSFTRTF